MCLQMDEALMIALNDAQISVTFEHQISSVTRSEAGYIRSVTFRNMQKKPPTEVEESVKNKTVASDVEKRGELKGGTSGAGSVNGSLPEDEGVEAVDDDVLTIECGALITCVKLQCDMNVFRAVNDSGLVFDGGIVVDQVRKDIDSLRVSPFDVLVVFEQLKTMES